ncbi:MAG: prepilin peptidase [Arenibacterium sp.]
MPAYVLPLLLVVAFFDLRALRIPDALTLVTLLVFFPVAVGLPFDELIFRVSVAGSIFAIGFFLFAFRLFGGGDVKFLPVLLLFVPSSELLTFSYCLSVSILLAILTLSFARRLNAPLIANWASVSAEQSLPLGVSFAYAGLMHWLITFLL